MTYARNSALGRYGEGFAANFLESLGFVVLDRNWRCRYGELDLIARDGSTLVVCEVKTRSSVKYGTPVEAVSAVKVTRLRRLCSLWLTESGLNPPSIRIDVISVLVPPRGAPVIERVAGVA